MKKEEGISLTGIIIYISILTIVLGLLISLVNFLKPVLIETSSSEAFDKFNVEFLKSVKNNENANVINNEDNVKIVFKDNTNYYYDSEEKAIYKNKTKIVGNVLVFKVQKKDYQYDQNSQNRKKILFVEIGVGKKTTTPDFGKRIKYVLKYW